MDRLNSGRGGRREGAGRPASGSVRKSFWIPQALLDRIDKLSRKRGISKGQIVSAAIETYLDEEEG